MSSYLPALERWLILRRIKCIRERKICSLLSREHKNTGVLRAWQICWYLTQAFLAGIKPAVEKWSKLPMYFFYCKNALIGINREVQWWQDVDSLGTPETRRRGRRTLKARRALTSNPPGFPPDWLESPSLVINSRTTLNRLYTQNTHIHTGFRVAHISGRVKADTCFLRLMAQHSRFC